MFISAEASVENLRLEGVLANPQAPPVFALSLSILLEEFRCGLGEDSRGEFRGALEPSDVLLNQT